ncbi:hypothetical protein CSUI_007030 [Cystoisospora suis]|uniref:Uncharacterized protein n=1 Tax=Cystoisospora suis TaxID=483139 RepID=A0A2C6KNL8_9APIC|nr:hypothetical protein CSUI_007030 [Cystoisospora suis]
MYEPCVMMSMKRERFLRELDSLEGVRTESVGNSVSIENHMRYLSFCLPIYLSISPCCEAFLCESPVLVGISGSSLFRPVGEGSQA